MGNHKLQIRIAASFAGLGLALLAWMVYSEGEPGAIPLALVLGGAGWWFVARRRAQA